MLCFVGVPWPEKALEHLDLGAVRGQHVLNVATNFMAHGEGSYKQVSVNPKNILMEGEVGTSLLYCVCIRWDADDDAPIATVTGAGKRIKKLSSPWMKGDWTYKWVLTLSSHLHDLAQNMKAGLPDDTTDTRRAKAFEDADNRQEGEAP